jgi:glyoxylase-like metal-dependent hydrolase (beta-lactamase superfamily II)
VCSSDLNQYIAIDAGNNEKRVRQELDKLKVDPDRVVAVFLTHTDADHVAALGLFRNAVIYISKAEEQMINGQTSRFLIFKNKLGYPYKLLEDNQILDASGLKVRGILIPGHTPGSMCYLVNDVYLFTGDSLSLKNGKVDTMIDFFNMDSEMQRRNLRKLAALPNVKYIFTAHYGFTDNYQYAFDTWKD